MTNLQTILHPTDLSPDSQYACQLACELARDRDARLVLLHVAPPLPSLMSPSNISLLDPYNKRFEADRKMWSLDCGDLRPSRFLRAGDAATVILNTAERVNADLIVLGQPRQGKWWWLIEDRVAETVVRKASRPVFIATNHKASAIEPGTKSQVGSNRWRAVRPLSAGSRESHTVA